jgi:hypothetical protein
MKLVKQSSQGFQYQLSPEEAHFLRLLVQQFPIRAFSPVTISKTDAHAVEREKLINESLAAHRGELKRKAGGLVREDKFKTSDAHKLFYVNLEERETLLQILNDIRVESWRILGEPENLDLNIFDLPRGKIRFGRLMHVAGYFEHHFLNLDEPNAE